MCVQTGFADVRAAGTRGHAGESASVTPAVRLPSAEPVSSLDLVGYNSKLTFITQAGEEIMAKVDQGAPQKSEFEEKADHAQKIKTQILEQTGRPPRLDHIEVCQHHNGNYRVNVWEQREPLEDCALSAAFHIAASYYLKVSDSGEIVHSNPPLTKRRFAV